MHYLGGVGNINIGDIMQIHDKSFRLPAFWDRKSWNRNLKWISKPFLLVKYSSCSKVWWYVSHRRHYGSAILSGVGISAARKFRDHQRQSCSSWLFEQHIQANSPFKLVLHPICPHHASQYTLDGQSPTSSWLNRRWNSQWAKLDSRSPTSSWLSRPQW